MNKNQRSNARNSRHNNRFDGIWYQTQDYNFIDYQEYQLDSGFYFRGPKPDLSKPYICFIGSAHTFGGFARIHMLNWSHSTLVLSA